MDDFNEEYRIPTISLPFVPIQEQLKDLIEFKEFIEEFDLSTKNSRIDRYIQYFEKIVNSETVDPKKIFKNSSDSPCKQNSDWFLYLLRELHELNWIHKGLKQHKPKGIKNKLEIIISGRDIAALDKNSLSRDIQFELRIASYFCQSKFEVDLSSETDIILMNSKNIYFIECKRITSLKALKERLSDAKEQLLKRIPKEFTKKPYYGIVALDVTKVAFPHNGLVFGVTPEHSKKNIQKGLLEIRNILENDNEAIFRENRNILEIWTNIHMPAQIFIPNGSVTRFSVLGLVNPYLDTKSFKAAKMLIDARSIATEPDSRELPGENLTIRKELIIPKGTLFHFEKDFLKEYLTSEDVNSFDKTAIVCTITLNNKEIKFSLIELEIVLGKYSKEERRRISEDLNESLFQLFSQLLFIRYPYNEYEL